MAGGDGRELATTAQAAVLDDPEFLRGLVQGALQAILEAEMDVHLGAGRYERTVGRTGHRNGTKPRTLHTRVGTLMEMDVQGVSTRADS
jgi:putative transposase